MTDDKLAQKRNTGPEPVKAEPNRDREKTYQPPNPPPQATAEMQKLPEKTAEDNVESDMSDAVDAVKKRV